ncbi:MAG: hypothetical protein RJB06_575 [Pseudomonadota bacterium]
MLVSLFRGDDFNHEGKNMNEDPRCCGTGTCIIDPEGFCWCGQKWDGEKMAMPKLEVPPDDGQVTQSKQGPSSADTQ